MAKMKRIHAIVYGTVQGVFFREQTRHKAKQLGVVGFVKNLPNGTVKVVAEGEEEQLKILINFCKKGSEAADVEDVVVEWETPTKEFSEFRIKY